MRPIRLLVGLGSGVMAASLAIGVPYGVAAASVAPAAVTGPPANVTYTTATATGDVNPGGSATTWYFQYGTTTAYGLKTAAHSAGAGGATVSVAEPLADLTPGSAYHYRLVAANKNGTVVGSDMGFNTPSSAPSVATEPATSVADTTAVLRGAVDPHGLETVAQFRYGTTSAYGAASAARSVGSATVASAVAIRVDGLARDTTYHYALGASNAVGSGSGADASFTTSGPAIIANGSPSSVTATSLVLNGSVDPGGHATNWFFQYGTTAAYGSDTAVRSAGAGMASLPVSAAVAGLLPGTAYHFRLVAKSADGTVVAGDAVVATLGPTLSVSPGVTIFGHAINLTGGIPTGASNESVTIFAQRATDPSFVGMATVLTGTGGAFSYSVTPRIGTTYKAVWDDRVTPVAAVGVRPSVSLRISGSTFTVHVSAARSLTNRLVRIQRLEKGRWVVVGSSRLGQGSVASVKLALPNGGSRLRAWVTAWQAGPGYLQGFSAVHRYTQG